MMLIQGKNTGGDVIAGAGKGKGLFGKLTSVPVLGSVAAVLSMSGDATVKPPRDLSNFDPKTGGAKGGYPVPFYQMKQQPSTTNNVTINVQGADPKATVDALSKYVKQNGQLPFNLQTVGKKP
jgi:hypothetical protein